MGLSLADGRTFSLFFRGLLRCCYCLHVLDVPLFLPGWIYVGTGSLVCAAVGVPADAAPGHCPSDPSAVRGLAQPSANPGLSNPGELHTEFTLPCREHFMHLLKTSRRKLVLAAHIMQRDLLHFLPHNLVSL